MNKSIDYRRNGRTIEEFEHDIKFRTQKEKFLVNLYKKEMQYRGSKVSIRSYGVDNTGKLIDKSSCKPDYKITINGRIKLVDIKNSPIDHKWTFKVYNIQQYIKYKASILVFWNTGYLDKNLENINYKQVRFGIISHKKMQIMLDSYQHYMEPKFGNKTCIQIPKKDFRLYCKIEKIKHI